MNTSDLLDVLPRPPADKRGWPWTPRGKFKYASRTAHEWPRITVITPSYNQGQYLEETIRSVLLQGYPNLEYFLFDGGSKDNSVEIIEKYRPFLSYAISEKDRGQSHAINKGMTRATGDILGWVNSDDRYVPGTLGRVAQAFERNPDSVAVHGDRIMIDSLGDVCGWTCLPPFDPARGEYTICSETMFWKRSAMEAVGILREDLQFAMDLEFFCRLQKYGPLTKINRFLGCFRCHALSKSSTIMEVGEREARCEWRRLFGTDVPEYKASLVERLQRRADLFIGMISNPQLVAWPYAVRRFLKGRRGMLENQKV
jgi:glycosyltransferase involved in cell wall biosynthesis